MLFCSLNLYFLLYLDAINVLPTLRKWVLTVQYVWQGQDQSSCFGIELVSKSETTLRFSDIYSAEFIDWGLVHQAAFLGQSFEVIIILQ